MKNQKRSRRTNSAEKSKRLSLSVIMAVCLLTIGAITVVSRQLIAGKRAADPAAKTANSNPLSKKYMTVKVAGRDVQVDPQTGQIKPLSAQEAQQLADGLKDMLKPNADGLVTVQNPDGSVSMDLKDHYRNVAVARVNEDGSVAQSCVDNPAAAASFFGIDPQLLGAPATKDQPATQRPTVTPVKNQNQ